jgi:hypothetical protein
LQCMGLPGEITIDDIYRKVSLPAQEP